MQTRMIMDCLQDTFDTIKVRNQYSVVDLQIHRPEADNSINAILLREITSVIRQLEASPAIKVVVLSGLKNSFCTGMDFKAVNEGNSRTLKNNSPHGYYEMLKLISGCSKVVISKVEGKVNAGGIGLIAASDIVIADEKATFGLSEALFGLLPACVMPFLIGRIGYQKAKWMTLITQNISAHRAFEIGLVDEVSNHITDSVQRNLLCLTRLEPDTVKDLKDYMARLWIINEQTQELAVSKLISLVRSDKVQSNIKNFVQNGKVPWDKS